MPNTNELIAELERGIFDLVISAEKADTMANVITNDYFSNLTPDTAEGKSMICWYFNFARKMHDILTDYIYQISQQAQKLHRTSEALDELKEGAAK